MKTESEFKPGFVGEMKDIRSLIAAAAVMSLVASGAFAAEVVTESQAAASQGSAEQSGTPTVIETQTQTAAPQTSTEQAESAAAEMASESPADHRAAAAFHAEHARKVGLRRHKRIAATEKKVASTEESTEPTTQQSTVNQAQSKDTPMIAGKTEKQ